MTEIDTLQTCVDEYVKYRDTVAVLAAIKRLVDVHPKIGYFVGVERTLETKTGDKITPDLVAIYDHDKAGLLFELKWSISPKTIKDELLDLKRYFDAVWTLSSKTITHNDTILVCHIEDAPTIIQAVKDLLRTPNNDFLKMEGFAVWTWVIELPKGADRRAVEEMRVQNVYGKTKNLELEKLIHAPGGMRVPQDVLRFFRNKYLFIKQKPPPQYTMAMLLLHVFTSFQQATHLSQILTLQQGMIDEIYERAKYFFPGWHEARAETIQMKKEWIREALDKFIKLKLRINLPIPRTRKLIQEVICKKLQSLERKRRIRTAYVGRKLRKPSTRDRKLTEFHGEMPH